jgi:formate hydrogenlyase transcriptional activator
MSIHGELGRLRATETIQILEEDKMASATLSFQPSAPATWQENPSQAFRSADPASEFEDVDVHSRSSNAPAVPDAFSGLIGTSEAIQRVKKQVSTVALTDSTVLLEGETGTGKELVSRAVHNLSQRKNRTLVKFNCAAIPHGLIETELFGHERGAFTGAIARKLGRFELADQGTLFLDEVGEIPLELQVKLLRVLQEQEFERLGGTQTQRVNVRLVAATNRNLTEMVSDQEFRSDLYFRLNVFPIQIPSLRERTEDIPLLAEHFLKEYSRRMDKQVDTIPQPTVERLKQHPWPGNVRELQNFIERAVILTTGPVLNAPLGDLKTPVSAEPMPVVTLRQAESSHILKILRETNWVLGGPRGAALRLGLKRTTLVSKMRKLGLSRPVPGVAL